MRNAKRLALLMTAVLLLTSVLALYSSAKTATKEEEVLSSVVPVYLVYEDEDRNVHPLQKGTAFFIDTKYVITSYHVSQLSEADAATIASYGDALLGFDADYFLQNYKNRTYCRVYISKDVFVKADMTSVASATDDYAVMKVEDTLNEDSVTILPLANSAALTNQDAVAAYGYSSLASNFNQRTINTKESAMTETGFVSKVEENNDGTMIIYHSCNCSEGMSGGPVLSKTQNGVVGITTGIITDGITSYNYAVGIDELKSNCEKFSIPYVDATNNNGGGTADDHDHVWGEAAFDSSDCCTYQICEICGERQFVSGPAHTEPDASVDDNWVITKEATKDEEGERVLKCEVCGEIVKTETIEKLKNNTMLYIIIAVVALVVIVAIILLLVLKGKKKNGNAPAPAPMNRGGAGGTGFNPPQPPVTPPGRPSVPPVPPTPPVFNDDAGATTVLDDGIGETSVLNTGAGETSVLATPPSGHLIRIKTGEKIDISGAEFVIGKERRKVNYCITGNNSISRSHAKVISRAGSHYVVDMNSTNFTFVNGSKLVPGQEKEIKDGDKIKLADEEFEFKAN